MVSGICRHIIDIPMRYQADSGFPSVRFSWAAVTMPLPTLAKRHLCDEQPAADGEKVGGLPDGWDV